jgi:hypothetical protein
MVDSDFNQDVALYDGLLIHIKPLINRLNYQIYIRNPLLRISKANCRTCGADPVRGESGV